MEGTSPCLVGRGGAGDAANLHKTVQSHDGCHSVGDAWGGLVISVIVLWWVDDAASDQCEQLILVTALKDP